ncbi:hypothetical protein WAI453_009112 [Rhynchosporium graminicola]
MFAFDTLSVITPCIHLAAQCPVLTLPCLALHCLASANIPATAATSIFSAIASLHLLERGSKLPALFWSRSRFRTRSCLVASSTGLVSSSNLAFSLSYTRLHLLHVRCLIDGPFWRF